MSGMRIAAAPAVQLAAGDDGPLLGTEGHGDAPGGSDTKSGPPGPVISRSWPQMTPAVDGILPGTTAQVEAGAPARATPPYPDPKEIAMAAAMAAAEATMANRQSVPNAVARRGGTMSRMLLC